MANALRHDVSDERTICVPPDSRVITIERFILDQEDKYPEATGELSNLLYDIALAAKIIAAASGGPGWSTSSAVPGRPTSRARSSRSSTSSPTRP